MVEEILISIVIPVKDGDYWLEETLGAIVRQTLFARSEVLIIDSGSTDRTREICKAFPVRIIDIPSFEFNHGDTRNLGVREAKGKYVVMTVQDARAVDERWLEMLLEGFTDEKVAGVCGQQVVPHDRTMNPVQWFRPFSAPRMVRYAYESALVFDGLPPREKKWASSWDDVNAMYRRDVLLKLPFRRMVFGEDMAWAIDALRSGYAIVYNEAARVYHYHHEIPSVSYKRMFAACYIRYRLVGFTYEKEGRMAIVRYLKVLLKEKVSVGEKIKWFLYNLRNRRSVNKAVSDFNELTKKGDQAVDDTYSKVCASSPVSIKPVD